MTGLYRLGALQNFRTLFVLFQLLVWCQQSSAIAQGQSGSEGIFDIPEFPVPTPSDSEAERFGGASYPFPQLPESTQIFSSQSICRQTYSTCMEVFRDCLRVVGPIGNGANQLCELYRNDVCEGGIREGCDRLPPDSDGQPSATPGNFTFSFTASPTRTVVPSNPLPTAPEFVRNWHLFYPRSSS